MGRGARRMIRLFNHYLHRRTVLQVCLDFLLVLAAVLAELLWRQADWSVVVPVLGYTALLSTGMVVINGSMGFYQRVHGRSLNQSRARAVLALLLALPMVYAVFGLVPLSIEGLQSLALTAIDALQLFLV